MKEVLETSAYIVGISSGISILVQFFLSVLKKRVRISWHAFYLSIIILSVSLLYIFGINQANKKAKKELEVIDSKLAIFNKYFVNPQLEQFVKNMSHDRDNCGIKNCPDDDASGKREYPEEIEKKWKELASMEEEGVQLTPEACLELGLFAYHHEEYSNAIRYAKMALDLRQEYTDAECLLCASYRCKNESDSTAIYESKYKGRRERQRRHQQ